jgi:mono/diheme cytochrome c family protein
LLLWRGRTALAGLLAVGVALTAAGAFAQNLDQGKSPAKLFSDNCATCHRSARGLAKGRFSFTLYLFLREHYASGSESAWTLASYLASVDAQAGGPKRATAKPPHAAGGSSRGVPRPPVSVPGR